MGDENHFCWDLDGRCFQGEYCFKTLPVDRLVAFLNFGDVTRLKREISIQARGTIDVLLRFTSAGDFNRFSFSFSADFCFVESKFV